MNLTTVFLFFLFFTANANGYSQLVSLSENDISLGRVFKVVKKQTGYTFVYTQSLLKKSLNVSLNVKDMPIEVFLAICFKNQPITYTLLNTMVVLKEKPFDALEQVADLPPPIEIKGRVTTENGDPLGGATVKEKGTSNATTSDIAGNFTLKVKDAKATLVVSYVGYKSFEGKVNVNGDFAVVLTLLNSSLNDVVVVGYGEQKKAKITGALSEIKSADINRSPAISASNSIVGRATGIIAVQQNGEPGGDASKIYIRGTGTYGTTDPLYVIDGIPRSASDFNLINPNEIENINILKDAASAAIFGVRSGNGVLLITTKRGLKAQTSLSYSFNYGIQQATRLPNFLGSYDYALLKNESLLNVGRPALFTQDQLQKYKDGSSPDIYPNTDWVKLALNKSAPQTMHNVSVRGGSEKIRYFINLGYATQHSIYKADQDQFNRYNLRSNIDADVTKTTHLTFDLSGRIDDAVLPSTAAVYNDGDRLREMFEEIFTKLPIEVARFSNGYYSRVNRGGNPLVRLDENNGYLNRNNSQFQSRLSITQDIPFIEGLSLKGIAAFDKGNKYVKSWGAGRAVKYYSLNNNGEYIEQATERTPGLFEAFGQEQRLTLEAHINYIKSIKDHHIGGLILYSQQDYKDNNLSGARTAFVSSALPILNVGGAATQTNNGSGTENAIKGVAGRINYDYKNTYLVEASFRYDGSTNFPKDTRWGFFPSVSVGWLVSNEKFLQNSPLISYLKLRGSIGVLGNDRIGKDYYYFSRYEFTNGYPFGAQVEPGIYQGVLPNNNVTWEKIRKTDIGLEVGLFQNRLKLEADYFFDHRTNILGSRNISIPSSFGASLPVENIAIIDNEGIELALTYRSKFSKNLSYNIGTNFTFARNKLIFSDEPLYAKGSVAERNKQTGRPLNQAFGFEALGIFQTQSEIDKSPKQFNYTSLKPGDIKYKDFNNDGKIDAEDVNQIGKNSVPEIIIGIPGGVRFKNAELNFLFQAGANANINHAAYLINGNEKYITENLDRWTPDNTNAKLPRIAAVGSDSYNNNVIGSTFWVKNVAYMRLKNLEIAYTFPAKISNRLMAKSIRFYANAFNLLTFTDFKYIDPENAAQNGLTYPQQKIYNLGLNVQF